MAKGHFRLPLRMSSGGGARGPPVPLEGYLGGGATRAVINRGRPGGTAPPRRPTSTPAARCRCEASDQLAVGLPACRTRSGSPFLPFQ